MMSSFIKIKPQILYAPMLATFGGGSVRGFGRGIGGASLTVDQVFSTDIYTGNGSTQSINNGIDLSGEGGLVWIKDRDSGSRAHYLFDSENLAAPNYNQYLSSNDADAIYSASGTGNGLGGAFTSNGFPVQGNHSTSGQNYVSWSFRSAPKFFDVQTWTGNNVNGRQIAHNLNTDVGFLVIKRTNSSESWVCWHNDFNGTTSIELNSTGGKYTNASYWNSTAPTSSSITLSSHNGVNGNGGTYVAYIFADNSSESAADRLISCGSYAGNGSSTGTAINVGFQPQFILYKNATSSDDWEIIDNVRGTTTNGDDKVLRPNLTSAELNTQRVNFLSNGWQPKDSGGAINSSGDTYIYMAIRAEG